MRDIGQQLVQHSPQAIMVIDREGRITQVNPAFEQVTGYSFADVAGENPRMLGAGHQNERFYDDLWLEVNSHDAWQGELWNRHKDGTIYPAWANIIKLEKSAGVAAGFVVQFFNISALKVENQSIIHSAQYDDLTQLPNGEMFQELLQRRVEQCQQNNEQLAVMVIDLDRFKWINDNLGRTVGDELLQEVARRLGSVVRSEDVLARLNSDEFVMLMPVSDSSEPADKVAQRVVEQLAQGVFVEYREIFVSASIGIAFYPEHASRGKDLIKKADVAMYAAKQGGRNTFRAYSELMERSKGPQILREEDLNKALLSGEIQMTYLPVYSIYSHQVVAVHARPSWQHSELGRVPFSDFSALLQSAETLDQYELWLEQELRGQGLIWERFPALRFISFRLESQQLRSKERIQHWLALLNQYQMQGRMMIDVDLQTAQEKEGALFDLLSSDALLSVSGFINEKPALEQLRDIDPDMIRLDAELVMTMTSDDKRQKIVDSILDIASRLDIEVLADGVATAGQRGQLMGQGCMLMQGRYFGLPLTLAQMLEHLSVEH